MIPTAEKVAEFLCNNEGFEYAAEYGEPGYVTEKGVIIGDWSDIPDSVWDYLEEAGYNPEYDYEWTIDYRHSKAYRTQPDSYSWQCMICYTDDGELLTPDSDIADWLHEHRVTDIGQPIKPLPGFIHEEDILSEGYEKFNRESYESGWHHGQNDDPQSIVKKIYNLGGLPIESIVFRLTSVGQFDVHFDVYVRCRYERYIHYSD